MLRYKVYGLHSGDGNIKYVGRTGKRLEERIGEHRRASRLMNGKGAGKKVVDWIREIGPDSLCFIVLSSHATLEEANLAEVAEISLRRGSILNDSPGGFAGPSKRSLCRRGHELTGDNVLKSSNGSGRKCYTCDRIAEKSRYPEKSKRRSERAAIRQAAGIGPIVGNKSIKNPTLGRYLIDRYEMGWHTEKISAECGVPVYTIKEFLRHHRPLGEFVERVSTRSSGAKGVYRGENKRCGNRVEGGKQ